jgi:hypothetical protein
MIIVRRSRFEYTSQTLCADMKIRIPDYLHRFGRTKREWSGPIRQSPLFARP